MAEVGPGGVCAGRQRFPGAPWGRVSVTGGGWRFDPHRGDPRLRDASWLPGEAFGGEERSLKCRCGKGQVFFCFFGG